MTFNICSRKLDPYSENRESEDYPGEFEGDVVERRVSPGSRINQIGSVRSENDSKCCCDDGFSGIKTLLDEGAEHAKYQNEGFGNATIQL